MTAQAQARPELEALAELDRRRRVRFVLTGALCFVLVVLANLIEAWVAGNWLLVAISAGLAGLAASALLVLRNGRLGAATHLCTAVVVLASLTVIASEGSGSNRLSMLLAGIIFVGLTERPWVAPVLALSLVALVLVTEAGGWAMPLVGLPRPLWWRVLRHVAVTTLLVVAFRMGFAHLLGLLAERARVLVLAEQELAEARARLEHVVADRSREIEHATRDLEAFVASVSHDLKAPLRHIEGFVELFLEGEGGPLAPQDEARLREVRLQAAALAGKVQAIVEREAARDRIERAALPGAPAVSTWP